MVGIVIPQYLWRTGSRALGGQPNPWVLKSSHKMTWYLHITYAHPIYFKSSLDYS